MKFKTKIKNNSLQNIKSKKKTSKNVNHFIDYFYNNIHTHNINNNCKLFYDFYQNNFDNDKFKEYNSNFKPFNKNMQGRSGGIVGTLQNDPNKILKIHLIKKHKVSDLIKCQKNNLNIDYRFNEIIINYVLDNLKDIPDINKKELEYVNSFLIKLYDFGFSNNAIYFINEKIGIEHKNLDNKINIEYFPNLQELITHNHTHFLKKAINTNNIDIIKTYDLLLAKKFEEFNKAILILQKYINYLNTDAKLNNVFIKKEKNTDPRFEILREYGFAIDFKLLISDLDKSIIILNNFKIFPLFDKLSVLKFIGIHFVGLINLKIRHFTHKNKIYNNTKNCDWLTNKSYDLLCITINLFLFLCRDISLNENNIIEYLPNFNKLIISNLGMSDSIYKILLKMIKANSVNYSGKHTSYEIVKIINKLCLSKK